MTEGETRWLILEGGMQSGKPSVMVVVKTGQDPDAWLVFELSYAIFDSIAAFFRGTAERWGAEGRA